ncbi:3356_t:CDS:1 [Acaulospora colombiana]|uniref:3356_t:CDS:1 n=1 Tax=Acaulospora colombiana TaxID=27376 RepID=A0ACA9NHD8_9GLOM|nr:3356_t:CDS:1 [Acaulospora colombiana]
MTEQPKPAVHRIPVELWWIILDEAIEQHNPLFFSTIFEGSSWLKHSSSRSFGQEDGLRARAESQRKVIGSVCRSWRDFARSRRDNYVTLYLDNKGELYGDIERAVNARRVKLYKRLYENLVRSIQIGQGFNWETVEISEKDALGLALIPLPHLRRLKMRTNQYFLLDPFLDTLIKFSDITWLDYDASIQYRGTISMGGERSPVVLPNLQVLCYSVADAFTGSLEFPFQQLILPSLRFLSFHMIGTGFNVPLIKILSRYRQTLRSVAVRVKRPEGTLPCVQFPPWYEFPKLEELAIDRPWVINFHSLSSGHPLQKLEAQIDSLGIIPSLLGVESLKEITLRRSRWAAAGGLTLTDKNGKLNIDRVKVDRLLGQAEGRETPFGVIWNGGYLPRHKATGSATEASSR